MIEIWNLVFMQYNRRADGSFEPLPAKVIDTGMGFERPLHGASGQDIELRYRRIHSTDRQNSPALRQEIWRQRHIDVAMRVIADHVRTIAFSSPIPSFLQCEGRYVIRRILRRAIRYAYTFLEQKQAFMYRLVDTLIESMGEAYPEYRLSAS